MRKVTLMILLLLAACVFISGEAFSAWTQPKGHSYNQLTLSYYRTVERWTTLGKDASGEVIDDNVGVYKEDSEEFNSTKITYYGEFGVTDKLTAIISGGWDWQRSNDTQKFENQDGPSGIGDIRVGLRRGLVDNLFGTGILMSTQVDVKIPEAYEYENPVEFLSLGDGQYDLKVALLFGRGFTKGYAWLNTAYVRRFENDEFDPITFKPSDQFKLAIGGGYPITSWLSISGLVEWTKSIGDAEVSDELVVANYSRGGRRGENVDPAVVLIKDTLGLEPQYLSFGIDLAFSITQKIQTVVSYAQDLRGFGDFRTEDWAFGRTVSVALVYTH